MSPLLLAASLLLALAVAWVTFLLTAMATSRRDDRFRTASERERREALRERALAYRWFEPLVDWLAGWNVARMPERWLRTLQHNLDLLDAQARWKASEYLAIRMIEAVVFLPTVGLATWLLFGVEYMVPAALLGYVVLGPVLVFQTIAAQAKRRLDRVRARLPYTIDLIALMLEGGSIFRDCLERAAEENAGHPLGEELDRVCASIRRGSSQADALREMARRLDDGVVHEVVFAITTAEDSSGQIKDTLRDLAEQVRLRRVQWLERQAEEAKVQITWPGLLIMIACLLIVVAPIVLAGDHNEVVAVALRIVFESGPDRGREFLVVGEREVRIGRGPGYHIVPRDTGWQGSLRITCSRGVYRVVNEMPHDIWRDGDTPFPQGSQEIWYHGATLQPTADTRLRAYIVDDPPDQAEPVVETTPRGSALEGTRVVFQWAVILICLPTAAVLFLTPLGPAERSSGEVRRDFTRALENLQEVGTRPALGRTATGLTARLREARFQELRSRPELAFRTYLAVRDDLDRLLAAPARNPDLDEPLQQVHRFVGDRILALTQSYNLRREDRR